MSKKSGAGRVATAIASPSNDIAGDEISFPTVVGVGASAGGLEAFTELLKNLPNDTGMAFVLIQHLDPKHDSHLTELLSKVTKMPVTEVQGDTPIRANSVYVIPSRCNLGIFGAVLRTLPRPETGRNMPIDGFFSALAANRGSKSIGVVLSGTATDGTEGIQEIKAAGGITFAQELVTAKFESMPQSAIATGAVDFILAPTGIARQLAGIAKDVDDRPEPAGDADIANTLRLVRTVTGADFSHYKHSTLSRRIKRRMALQGFARLEDYNRELERNREEAKALGETFFITVTQFFREPAVFDALKSTVFPALVDGRELGDPVRIWVPGCATGEEAYSIAICLVEFFQQTKLDIPFEIFATDISETAIEKARAGIYKSAALANVSDQRLSRFFTRSERGYQIAKNIRDVCVFARHNVAQDTPFSRLDLISCCNVLIYLGSVLQRKVLSVLHYALKPSAFLVLGPPESVGALSDSFKQVEKTQKIYRMLPPVERLSPWLNHGSRSASRVEFPPKIDQGRTDLLREADRLVLAEYAPPGAVIDDAMNIVQVRGRTAPYLELSPGEPTRNLLKLAREGLIGGLGKAISAARQTNALASEEGFRVEADSRISPVTIKVTPFRGLPSSEERHFLVLFEDVGGNAVPKIDPKPVLQDGNSTARLRRELLATREYLQSIIEDHATTLEELRASTEEAQAGNEELETAHEELESVNEELNTLNEELKISNVEFIKVNRDLANLLESISIPLVMVGRDLRIRRFTRAIEPMLNLIPSDVGRSIFDLQSQIELPDLRRLLLDAMDGGNRKPCDLRDSTNRWFSQRILPSVGPDGKIDGAVLMLIDIDAAKRGLDFAEAIVETVREPLVILNHNLEVVKANKTFYETFQAASGTTEGRLIYDLGNGQWNIPKLRELLENILPAHATFRDFEVTHDFEHVGRKVMLLNASEIFNPNAQARTILLAIEDATDRKQAEAALKSTNAELQHFAYALTHDLQEPVRTVVNFTELLGREYAGKMGSDADKFIGYSVAGALRIEALLKALLAYWEVGERKTDNFAAIDCGAMLAKAESNLQAAIDQSGAIITSDVLPTLIAEEIMLLQLFQNLISNSIKYKGAQRPRIHVSAEREPGGWMLTVNDNGIGIDPEDLHRVFGMFKRLHGSEIPGTGIGLALCRKLVERQGGRIWVKSEPGKGSEFTFTIPDNRKGITQLLVN